VLKFSLHTPEFFGAGRLHSADIGGVVKDAHGACPIVLCFVVIGLHAISFPFRLPAGLTAVFDVADGSRIGKVGWI